MTARLADISAHITGVGQLSAVVNAMRGIAGARAQQARSHLLAVDRYAATIAAAIGRIVPLARRPDAGGGSRGALIVFAAEQGFAGGLSELVLAAARPEIAAADLMLVGTRGSVVAGERGIRARWKLAMPAHSPGIPKLAGRIMAAVAPAIAAGEIGHLSAIYATHEAGREVQIKRLSLFPLEPAVLPPRPEPPPLLNLSADALLPEFTADYIHAQLCHAALHAFAAENEARMQTMAAAHGQIERTLSTLRAEQRSVRQSEITAEIIELAAGKAAARR